MNELYKLIEKIAHVEMVYTKYEQGMIFRNKKHGYFTERKFLLHGGKTISLGNYKHGTQTGFWNEWYFSPKYPELRRSCTCWYINGIKQKENYYVNGEQIEMEDNCVFDNEFIY